MANDTPLLPQTTIPFQGRSLRIDRLVGSGATSEVYQGVLIDEHDRPAVAVKAMKPLEFAGARKFFLDEALTLAQLPDRERETNEAHGLPAGFHVAPAYFGSDTYKVDADHKVDFLVMAWIDGRQLPDLLAESTDGRLPEAQALTAGFHLYRTLDLLHTTLRKSYIDLKFENLWWDGPPDGGQLRMTDFGTLEDIHEGNDRGVRRDLLVAATYLCKLLTGYMPHHTAGELREAVVPLIQRADISWGARQLLSRLLHPNADERPRAAADVLTPGRSPVEGGPDLTALIGLTDLVDYWRRSPESLVAIKDRNWGNGLAAEGNERLKLLGRARVALDIWARRSPAADAPRVSQEVAQLDELLQQSGLLDRGRALFNAGTYSQAETLFAQGRSQSYEPARIALFRRWAYLAQIGLDPKVPLAHEHRQDLIRVVDQLSRREWDAAGRQLAELRPALGQAAAFQRLEADVALHRALDRAAQDTGDYDAAVRAYDDALAALDRLPQKERDDIIRDETGKLLPERERLAGLAAERAGQSAGAKLMAEAVAHLDAGRGLETVVTARRALIVEPSDLDARRRELAGLIDRVLSGGDYPLAAALAAVGLEGRGDARELRDRARLAGALRDAEAALGRGDTAGFVARVDTLSRLPGGPERLAALLGRVGERAKESNDAGLLRALAGLPLLAADRADLNARADAIDRNWRADADRRAAEQRDRLRPVVDERLSEAERFLYLADPTGVARRPDFAEWRLADYLAYLSNRQAALQQAENHAQQARARAGEIGHRVEEAEALLKRVQWARNRLSADAAAAQTALTRNSQQATEARQRLAEMAAALAAPVGIAGVPPADPSRPAASAPADAAAQSETARNLLLGGRWYLAAADPADQQVALWVEQAAARLDYLGPDGWAELQQTAGDRLAAFQAAFTRAEAAFARGETAEDGQPLTTPLALYGGAPEYAAFAGKWGRGVEWQRAGDSFQNRPADRYQPDALAALRRWLPLSLPPAFWERSPAASWLATTTAAAADEAARSMAVVRQPFVQPYAQSAGRNAGPHYDAHGQPVARPPAHDERPAGNAPRAAAGPAAYLDTLKWWFDAAATGRLAAGEPPADGAAWSAPAVLRAAAAAALAGDAAALGRVIAGSPPPPDVGRALDELTPEAWRQAVESQRRPDVPDIPPTPRPRWLPYALAGAALAVLLLLAGLGYLFRDRLGLDGLLGGTPTVDATVVAANATATAAAALAALPPTLTPSPTAPPTPFVTPTLMPTLTLTPTVTPTPTATAPPPEASGFFVSDPAQLPLAAPVSGATLWLMSPDAASALPPPGAGPWQTDTDPVIGDISYIEDFSSPVSLSWIHDQPLAEGLYQLYVIDTTVRSVGAQTFEVLLDGQPVEPARGVRDVIFDCYDECGQREPTWLPIGAYAVQTGQRLSVRAVADPARMTSFAAPWLLVARLGDRERALLEALPAPDMGRPLVVLLDDDRLQVYNSSTDGNFGFTDESQWPGQQEAAADPALPPVWNGRYRPATLDPTEDFGLRAEWLPLGRLAAGEYQLYAHVPAGSNALVNYDVVVDGAPVETIVTSTEQRNFAGEWVDLGVWTVPEEAGVSVWATALKSENAARYTAETSWVIGADAVALLRVGE